MTFPLLGHVRCFSHHFSLPPFQSLYNLIPHNLIHMINVSLMGILFLFLFFSILNSCPVRSRLTPLHSWLPSTHFLFSSHLFSFSLSAASSLCVCLSLFLVQSDSASFSTFLMSTSLALYQSLYLTLSLSISCCHLVHSASFEWFRERTTLNVSLEENRSLLKNKITEAKTLGERVNQSR